MMSKGFSLLELMVGIVIVGILMAVGIPAMSDFTVQMRVDNEIGELRRALLSARNSAVTSGYQTTICPLNGSNNCTTNWQNDISVFTDIDGDEIYEPGDNELLITVKNAIDPEDSLTYNRAATNGITYTPDGTIRGVNSGTFIFCPSSNDRFARGVIVATSGRTRKTQDLDDDGIDNHRTVGVEMDSLCP